MDSDKTSIDIVADHYKSKYPRYSSQIEEFKNALIEDGNISDDDVVWVSMAFENSLKKVFSSKNPEEHFRTGVAELKFISERANNTRVKNIGIILVVCMMIVALVFFGGPHVTLVMDEIKYYLGAMLLVALAFSEIVKRPSKSKFLLFLSCAGLGLYDGANKLIHGFSFGEGVYLCGIFFFLVMVLRNASNMGK